VSPVEAAFELGGVARRVLDADRTAGSGDRRLMLPSAVSTHLKAGLRAAAGSDPVVVAFCPGHAGEALQIRR